MTDVNVAIHGSGTGVESNPPSLEERPPPSRPGNPNRATSRLQGPKARMRLPCGDPDFLFPPLDATPRPRIMGPPEASRTNTSWPSKRVSHRGGRQMSLSSVRRHATAVSVVAAEPLEARQLLSVSVNINFQPPNKPVPAGYLADVGRTFSDYGNGF